MLAAELVVVDAGVVTPDHLERSLFLGVIEKPGSALVVREKKPENDGPQNGECARDEEHPLPRRNTDVDMPKPV